MCAASFGWCHLVNAYGKLRSKVSMVVWVACKNCVIPLTRAIL